MDRRAALLAQQSEKQAQRQQPESGTRAPLSRAGTAALLCHIKQCALPERSRIPAALSEADGTDDHGQADRREELSQALHLREEAQQLRPPSADLARRDCDREVDRQRSGREEYSDRALEAAALSKSHGPAGRPLAQPEPQP